MADRPNISASELLRYSTNKSSHLKITAADIGSDFSSDAYTTRSTNYKTAFLKESCEDKDEALADMAALGGSDSSSGGAGGPEEDEEDRLRRLFQVCDRDGDGLIDQHDLNSMCRLLGMEDSVKEITQQLGMGSISGREHISFDDFVQTRARVINELEDVHFRDQRALNDPVGKEVWKRTTSAVSSDNSLEHVASDSLEYDSGARDVDNFEHLVEMIPFNQPESLYVLLERHDPEVLQTYLDFISSLQLTGNATKDILQEANRHYMAAVLSLQSDLTKVAMRAQRAVTQLHLMQKQVSWLQAEKRLVEHNASEHAENLVIRYEDRLTELHSVIAELRKKLDHRHITVIREVDELDENDSVQSNRSNDDRSINDKSNGEDSSPEFSTVVSDLESALVSCSKFSLPRSLNESLVRTSKDCSHHSAQALAGDSAQSVDATHETSLKVCLTDTLLKNTAEESFDFGRLELKLEMLEQHNENLLEQTGLQEAELICLRNELIGVREEKEEYKRKLLDLLSETKCQGTEVTVRHSPNHSHLSAPTKQTSAGLTQRLVHQSQQQVPLAKVAELKRLKTGKQDRPVLGAEISSLGLASAKMAEHLAQGMHESSSLQEMLQLAQLGGAADGGVNLAALNKIREFEIDLERLQSKADNLKSQNDVLMLTLQESKALCDRLTVLMGRYESNNTALQMSVAYSDQALEIYSLLTALLDTELALVLARFAASGLTTFSMEQVDSTQLLQKSLHARNDIEHMARQLLARYDGHVSEALDRTACAPWEELSSTSQTISTTSSATSADDFELSKEDEKRLRDHLHALLTDRAAIKLTVMELESIYLDPVSCSTTSAESVTQEGGGHDSSDALRLDLENAVLMQELMAMKEEKAELRAENYLLEKERASLDLELSGRESQSQTYLTQIEHLKTELTQSQTIQRMMLCQKREMPDVTCSLHSTDIQCTDIQCLSDSSVSRTASAASVGDLLKRDAALRSRINELMTSLDTLSKSSEQRHQQSAMFVNELKRANSALVSAFEKTKKKKVPTATLR